MGWGRGTWKDRWGQQCEGCQHGGGAMSSYCGAFNWRSKNGDDIFCCFSHPYEQAELSPVPGVAVQGWHCRGSDAAPRWQPGTWWHPGQGTGT